MWLGADLTGCMNDIIIMIIISIFGVVICRLHEALAEVHARLTIPPVPVNPFPAVTQIMLKYACHLDAWDSNLVSAT